MIDAMKFEKWQALGNDYLIVEAAGRRARARQGAVRPPPRRRRRRRARARARPTSPATSPACGSTTPTARRPSCRATAPARRCSTCASTAGRRSDTYSIQTVAGEIRTTITGEHTLPRRHGPRDRRASTARSAACASSTSRSATRRPPIRIADASRSSRPSTSPRSARRSSTTTRSPTAPTSRSGPSSAPTASARASSSAGWGRRMSSGTGASGAAVAHVLRGGDSPVTVVLDGGELRSTSTSRCTSTSTGWAVPVFRGELA